MPVTDRELIERAKRGDNAAFGELWERYEREVVTLCRRYLSGSRHDPVVDEHDLATDTFIRALHGLERYEDRSAEGVGFDTWLLEVAKRTCLKFLSKQRRREQWLDELDEDESDLSDQPDFAPAVERVVEERETLRLAAQEINALPPLYRAPFKLFLEEYSQKEIAEALGISVDNAAKRVQRARVMLQPRLAELFGMEWRGGMAGRQQRRVRAGARAVERALTDIVSEYRIVGVTLPSGGEIQLCLRVEREMASREPEIETRRAQLQNKPRAWKQRLELAELCYHSGRWAEAREEYRAALAANPRCFAAALRLGAMLQQEEKQTEAAEVYRAALGQKPPTTLRAQLQAHLLAAEGQYDEAVKAFRRAIALAPKEKSSYYGLHHALGRLSRYEEQLENIAKVRQLDPDDLFALVSVYTPCARLRRFDIARPLLERAVTVDPHSPMAVKHLFQVRMNLSLFDDETLELAERLVRLAPQLSDSWHELSWIYRELGRDEESIAVLRQFVQEHPHNAESLAALSWGYGYLGRGEEQYAHARRAYQLAPQNWYVCWTLLVACHPPMAAEEAMRYAEEIAAQFPHDAWLMQHVAALCCHQGREAEALHYAQRAVELSPEAMLSRAQLARVYYTFGCWQEAADAYERLSQMPEGRVHDWLREWGESLAHLNDPRAEEVFAEALTLAQQAGDDFRSGWIYESWGKREEAIAAYRRCLSRSPLPTYLRLRVEERLRRLGVCEGEGRAVNRFL
jgi:RNA polymerase sigma factor (sigma-70 family)